MGGVYTQKKVIVTFMAVSCLFVFFFADSSIANAQESTESEEASEAGADPRTEEADLERARALFMEGVELADQGQHETAAERFESALLIHEAPTIHFNLAAVYVELDRLLQAASHLELVIDDSETDEELRQRAQQMYDDVSSRLGRLLLSRGGLDWDATVTLNGRELDVEEIDAPQRVEPGTYTVVATLDGEEVARHEVEVPAGALIELELAPHRDDVETAIVESAEEEREVNPILRDWRLWTGVGAGVVVVVTAVVLGVTLSNREQELEDPVTGNMSPGVITWP